MKTRHFYYLLIIVGFISLFATCKNTITDTEHSSEEEVIDEEIEVDLKEVDDYSEAMPKKISLANQGNYQFERNYNPYNQQYFQNPFDSTIEVSGTFCELRGNHFHGGLDIRTGGREGWPVKASAAGYVERIKVSTKGYGRVLYIRHPNGYTTVYGHLQQFKGAIANYIRAAQYQQRKFEIELYPNKNELKVTQGQLVALSGNTGGSGGPHLHFEIRNPKGQSTNPLMHGLEVKDNLKPVIKNISIYLKDKNSLVENGNYPYKIVNRNGALLNQTQALNVKPGTYSFGLHTDDYFSDRRNKLGINYCWVTTNGYLLYQYQIEKFEFPKGRYINTHTDPYLDYKTNRTYIRLFKENFNPLGYYKQNTNGEIWLKHGDSVQMKVYVQDYAGHIDSVSWIMVGDTTSEKLKFNDSDKYDFKKRVSKTKSTYISYENWNISVPGAAVYHPFDFKLTDAPKRESMLSNTLQMHYPYTPLHKYISVSYKLPADWLKYGNKLCAFSFDGKRKYYEGGSINGSSLKFRTRSLGEYAIAVDDLAPKLKPLQFGKNYKFRVTDNLSGVDRIICTLDGKWILAEYEPKTNLIWGSIPNWIKPGEHQFKLIVIDHRGNRTEFNKPVKI